MPRAARVETTKCLYCSPWTSHGVRILKHLEICHDSMLRMFVCSTSYATWMSGTIFIHYTCLMQQTCSRSSLLACRSKWEMKQCHATSLEINFPHVLVSFCMRQDPQFNFLVRVVTLSSVFLREGNLGTAERKLELTASMVEANKTPIWMEPRRRSVVRSCDRILRK